jgi:hypothetical protein
MNDWDNLFFNFRSGNTYIDGVYSPSPPEITGETIEEIKEANPLHYGDLAPPIKPDGSRIFKFGNVIPVKVQLAKADETLITTAPVTFSAVKIGPPDKVVNITDDVAFRYDPLQEQYVYNWSTKKFKEGIGMYGIKVFVEFEGQTILLDADGDGYTGVVTLR